MVYFICGLNSNDSNRFFIFYFYSYLLVWSLTGFGFWIGAIVPDKDVGLSIMAVVVVASMVVSGFFVSQDNMVSVLIPFKYISPNKWAFQAYLLNEYEGLVLDWSPRWNPLQSLGFEETLGESILATAILGIVWYILTYLTLCIIARNSRK